MYSINIFRTNVKKKQNHTIIIRYVSAFFRTFCDLAPINRTAYYIPARYISFHYCSQSPLIPCHNQTCLILYPTPAIIHTTTSDINSASLTIQTTTTDIACTSSQQAIRSLLFPYSFLTDEQVTFPDPNKKTGLAQAKPVLNFQLS